MDGLIGLFFLENRCLVLFDLIPMALDWCFLLLIRLFRTSIIGFTCFLHFGLAFGPHDANGKTSQLEIDLKQAIYALYLARKIKQMADRRNSGANAGWP